MAKRPIRATARKPARSMVLLVHGKPIGTVKVAKSGCCIKKGAKK